MLPTIFTLTALLVASANASPVVVSRQLSSAGWSYKGCFTEATGQRALVGKAYFDDLMTHEKCAAACSAFSYFGVEYGRECWCSNNGLNEGSVTAPEDECSTKCPGNLSRICGAGDRLTVYSKGSATSSGSPAPTVSPLAYTAIGCYTDNTSGRALVDANYYDDDLTVEKCALLCSPYQYYGLEYGRECRCGKTLRNSLSVSASECNFPCAGNAQQTCGAGDRMNLYSLGGITPEGPSTSSSTASSSSESSSASSTEISTSSSTAEATVTTSTEISATSSSLSSEATTVSSTDVSSTISTVLSTSESSSSVTTSTTETPTLSSTTALTTQSPSTTSVEPTTTTTTTTSTVPVATFLVTSPILNSGFEIPGPIHWSPYSATRPVAYVNMAGGRPHSGTSVYRVIVPVYPDLNYASFRQTYLPGTAHCLDRIYKWQAFVRVTGSNLVLGGVKVNIAPFDVDAPYQVVTSQEWQKIEGYFAVPNVAAASGISVNYIVPSVFNTGSSVFFDDITVTLTPLGTALPPI